VSMCAPECACECMLLVNAWVCMCTWDFKGRGRCMPCLPVSTSCVAAGTAASAAAVAAAAAVNVCTCVPTCVCVCVQERGGIMHDAQAATRAQWGAVVHQWGAIVMTQGRLTWWSIMMQQCAHTKHMCTK